jgi:RHS repeat-associated protein
MGGSAILDGVICRYRDANTAWTAASDGVLEERRYLCQNWRGDVSAVIDTAGAMVEWVKYLSYGIPFALPAGDTDSDGDCDGTDTSQIQTWINNSTYDVRGDLDLDGDVDATDKTIAVNNFRGTTLGFRVLSNVGNRKGYAGYERDVNCTTEWHVRHRMLDSGLGRWLGRDPIVLQNPYEYSSTGPISHVDPSGLTAVSLACGASAPPITQQEVVIFDIDHPLVVTFDHKPTGSGQLAEIKKQCKTAAVEQAARKLEKGFACQPCDIPINWCFLSYEYTAELTKVPHRGPESRPKIQVPGGDIFFNSDNPLILEVGSTEEHGHLTSTGFILGCTVDVTLTFFCGPCAPILFPVIFY